ncbi:flagellar basal body-associated FliL family protein [Ruegeria arenilitoris]|uniref:flagellar basal body-associated FliL family protein n=1 Tax=Ruegeria arenilitoris TaxID=1173585 RepID=UPI00147F8F21|nr:flagellar basal body-associated FliL family protein [Ruegeria arenilitoris]
MKKLLPVLFLIAGLGAGAAAGLFLTPGPADTEADAKAPEPHAVETAKETTDKANKTSGHSETSVKAGPYEYLKLTKQFVVPVVEENEISALVTMSLSLETRPGISEEFYEIEPKLRDGFLQVLFDHANIGGFDGEFTQSDNLEVLRRSLLEVARKDLGDDVSRVLIMSVSRQDT